MEAGVKWGRLRVVLFKTCDDAANVSGGGERKKNERGEGLCKTKELIGIMKDHLNG